MYLAGDDGNAPNEELARLIRTTLSEETANLTVGPAAGVAFSTLKLELTNGKTIARKSNDVVMHPTEHGTFAAVELLSHIFWGRKTGRMLKNIVVWIARTRKKPPSRRHTMGNSSRWRSQEPAANCSFGLHSAYCSQVQLLFIFRACSHY